MKKHVLALAITVSMMGLTACSSPATETASESGTEDATTASEAETTTENVKTGTTISFISMNESLDENMMKEFTEATGIQVQYEYVAAADMAVK